MKVIPFTPSTGHDTRTLPAAVRVSLLHQLLRAAVGRLAGTLQLWRRRSRERAQLATLDDRMLRDIGVSRADIWDEIHKPFWRK